MATKPAKHLSIPETCIHMGLSPSTVNKLANKGELTRIYERRRVVFAFDDVEQAKRKYKPVMGPRSGARKEIYAR